MQSRKQVLKPGVCAKYFLSFPQKNRKLPPEKTDKVFTFQFLNDDIHNYVKKHNCEFYHTQIEK